MAQLGRGRGAADDACRVRAGGAQAVSRSSECGVFPCAAVAPRGDEEERRAVVLAPYSGGVGCDPHRGAICSGSVFLRPG